MWAAAMLLWALRLPAAEEPTPPPVVQWTASPGCADGPVVRERVGELLAPGPGTPTWQARGQGTAVLPSAPVRGLNG